MKIGKVPENVLKRSVFKQIHTKRPEVVLGAGVGEDCAAVKLAEDETLVMSTDPITGTAQDIGTLAIQITANDLASAGAEPVGVLLTVLLPPETEKLTAAAQAVARKELDSAVFSGAKVREYESTLQALQTMGDALTGSLQKQWAMEQRQREQIIQLSHKLKTPLTIIEGNAELLAEDDDLTAEQKAQVESILQGAEQTRTYLGKIRAEVQTPLRYKRNVE